MKLYYIFLLNLFFISCDKQIVPSFSSIDEKLVVIADFNLINGISIQINKAIASTAQKILYKDLIVNDAVVYLMDSASNKPWLIPFDTSNMEYINQDLKPIANSKYRILINWNSKNFNSVFISVPDVPLFQIKDKEMNKETIYGNSGFKFTYKIMIDSSSANHVYSSGAILKSKRFDRKFGFDEFIQKEDLCGYYFGLLPGRCLSNKLDNYLIVGYILNQFRKVGSTDTKDDLYKGKHYMYFSTISPNFYTYTLAIREPEPFEKYFLNPSAYPSDFPNSFGIFSISNMVIIDSINIQ